MKYPNNQPSIRSMIIAALCIILVFAAIKQAKLINKYDAEQIIIQEQQSTIQKQQSTIQKQTTKIAELEAVIQVQEIYISRHQEQQEQLFSVVLTLQEIVNGVKNNVKRK